MNTTGYNIERRRNLERFGANIRRLRTAKGYGISQEEFAHLTRLHRTQIGKIERGEIEPLLSTLLILADVFGVTIDDLVVGLEAPVERRPAPRARSRP